MATVTANLPSIGASVIVVSTSVASGTVVLPALEFHLASGVQLVPPMLTGTAVVRGLTGTATVT